MARQYQIPDGFNVTATKIMVDRSGRDIVSDKFSGNRVAVTQGIPRFYGECEIAVTQGVPSQAVETLLDILTAPDTYIELPLAVTGFADKDILNAAGAAITPKPTIYVKNTSHEPPGVEDFTGIIVEQQDSDGVADASRGKLSEEPEFGHYISIERRRGTDTKPTVAGGEIVWRRLARVEEVRKGTDKRTAFRLAPDYRSMLAENDIIAPGHTVYAQLMAEKTGGRKTANWQEKIKFRWIEYIPILTTDVPLDVVRDIQDREVELGKTIYVELDGVWHDRLGRSIVTDYRQANDRVTITQNGNRLAITGRKIGACTVTPFGAVAGGDESPVPFQVKVRPATTGDQSPPKQIGTLEPFSLTVGEITEDIDAIALIADEDQEFIEIEYDSTDRTVARPVPNGQKFAVEATGPGECLILKIYTNTRNGSQTVIETSCTVVALVSGETPPGTGPYYGRGDKLTFAALTLTAYRSGDTTIDAREYNLDNYFGHSVPGTPLTYTYTDTGYNEDPEAGVSESNVPGMVNGQLRANLLRVRARHISTLGASTTRTKRVDITATDPGGLQATGSFNITLKKPTGGNAVADPYWEQMPPQCIRRRGANGRVEIDGTQYGIDPDAGVNDVSALTFTYALANSADSNKLTVTQPDGAGTPKVRLEKVTADSTDSGAVRVNCTISKANANSASMVLWVGLGAVGGSTATDLRLATSAKIVVRRGQDATLDVDDILSSATNTQLTSGVVVEVVPQSDITARVTFNTATRVATIRGLAVDDQNLFVRAYRESNPCAVARVTIELEITDEPNRSPTWNGPGPQKVVVGATNFKDIDLRDFSYDKEGDPVTFSLRNTPDATKLTAVLRPDGYTLRLTGIAVTGSGRNRVRVVVGQQASKGNRAIVSQPFYVEVVAEDEAPDPSGAPSPVTGLAYPVSGKIYPTSGRLAYDLTRLFSINGSPIDWRTATGRIVSGSQHVARWGNAPNPRQLWFYPNTSSRGGVIVFGVRVNAVNGARSSEATFRVTISAPDQTGAPKFTAQVDDVQARYAQRGSTDFGALVQYSGTGGGRSTELTYQYAVDPGHGGRQSELAHLSWDSTVRGKLNWNTEHARRFEYRITVTVFVTNSPDKFDRQSYTIFVNPFETGR